MMHTFPTHLEHQQSPVVAVRCHGDVLKVVSADIDLHLDFLTVQQAGEAPTVPRHAQLTLQARPGYKQAR